MTTSDLNKAISSISKDKKQRPIEYNALCQQIKGNIGLLESFFSHAPYTGRHIELAARMYTQYGFSIYNLVKQSINPNNGKYVANWDEFILLTVDKLYEMTYAPGAKYGYQYAHEFFADICPLCDSDLQTELSWKICQIPSNHPQSLTINIDRAYFQRRISTIGLSENGMRRYVQLMKALARYDYLSTYDAWEQFYEYFNDLFDPNSRSRYTGSNSMYAGVTWDIVNLLIAAPTSIWNSDYSHAYSTGEKRFSEIMAKHGWKYVHALYEKTCDTSSQKRVYEYLSDADKKRADEAIAQNKIRTIPRDNTDSSASSPESIANMFQINPTMGLVFWKSQIVALLAETKITKTKRYDVIDKVFLKLCQNYDLSAWQLISNPIAPLVQRQIPNVFNTLLGDNWLLSTLFSNCQTKGAIIELLALTLYTGKAGLFRELLVDYEHNPFAALGVDELCEKAIDSALQECNWIKKKIKDNDRIKERIAEEAADSGWTEITYGIRMKLTQPVSEYERENVNQIHMPNGVLKREPINIEDHPELESQVNALETMITTEGRRLG